MKHTIPLDKTHFKDFLLAGIAEFTIVSKETNTRFSYIVEKCPPEKSTTKIPPIWVSMYMNMVNSPGRVPLYMGVIWENDDGAIYVHNRNRNHYSNHKGIQAFKWIFKHRDNVPETAEIYHVGKCAACQRKLTTPSSIKMGLGPICAKNLK